MSARVKEIVYSTIGSKRPWARRVVCAIFDDGSGWDGGLGTVYGSDTVPDPRPGPHGQLRHLAWPAGTVVALLAVPDAPESLWDRGDSVYNTKTRSVAFAVGMKVKRRSERV